MVRRLVVVGLALVALFVGLGSASATARPALATVRGTPSVLGVVGPEGEGAAQLASCLQNARSLSALFLLDRSGSLSSSDPNGIRYEGLTTALEQLSRLNRPDGKELAVEAAVSAFDNNYYPATDVHPWFRVNEGDVGNNIKDVVDEVRPKTAPQGGTDFEVAINGALQEFAGRDAATNCRVILWFTDGQFEHARDSVPAARARLCAPGGAFDTARQSQVTVIGLQLGQRSPDLATMSLASATEGQCGTVPLPEGWRQGIYLRADDAAGLKRIFGGITDIVSGCTPTGSLGNTIDPGIRRMRITIPTPKKVTDVRLGIPDGTSINAPASGATEAGGYRVTSLSDDQFVSMEVVFPPGKGAGSWTVIPDVAVAVSDMTFCVFADIHLAVPNGGAVGKSGAPSDIALSILDRDNKPTDLTAFTVSTGATAVGVGGRVAQITASPPTGNTVKVSVTSALNEARLDASVVLNLTTKSGLKLLPVTYDFPIALGLPSAFPAMRPVDKLVLSPAIKLDPARGSIAIAGSPDGPTQVCFDQPKAIAAPAESGKPVLTVPQGCVNLAVNEHKTVAVSVTPEKAATGDGSMQLPITLVSAPINGKPATSKLELPVEWRFENPLNPCELVIAILVSLGLSLLPILALGLANKITSRYEMRGLVVESFLVAVGRDGVTRADGVERAVPVLIDKTLMFPVSGLGASPRRSFTVGPVVLKSKSSMNPATAPTFWAEAVDGELIFGLDGVRRQTVGSDSTPQRRRWLPWAKKVAAEAPNRKVKVPPGLGFVALLTMPAQTAPPGRHDTIPATLTVLLRDHETTADELSAAVLAAFSSDYQEVLGSTADAGATASDPGGRWSTGESRLPRTGSSSTAGGTGPRRSHFHE